MYLKFEMVRVYTENKSADFIKPWAGPYIMFYYLENPYEETWGF